MKDFPGNKKFTYTAEEDTKAYKTVQCMCLPKTLVAIYTNTLYGYGTAEITIPKNAEITYDRTTKNRFASKFIVDKIKNPIKREHPLSNLTHDCKCFFVRDGKYFEKGETYSACDTLSTNSECISNYDMDFYEDQGAWEKKFNKKK